MKRIAVLASGTGTNFQALIDACDSGELDAEIVALATDKKCPAVHRAEAAGIPIVFQPWGPYKVAKKLRETYDRDLAVRIMMFQPDLVVLAGWMRILTMGFLEVYPMRVINLHPALPGMFPGTHAIARAWDAYHRGEITHTGVMVHFVPDEGVDEGPVIAQADVEIHPDDTFETLEARVHAVEHRLLVDAVRTALEEVDKQE